MKILFCVKKMQSGEMVSSDEASSLGLKVDEGLTKAEESGVAKEIAAFSSRDSAVRLAESLHQNCEILRVTLEPAVVH